MSTFTDRELLTAQILGGSILALSLMMGLTGTICLKQGLGAPEYITCLRNTGWTLALLGGLWTALATWRRISS